MSRRTIALILSPLGLLLISAARLIVVSDYNTTTAVTIASSGGYINTLLGSFIPLVPVFAPYLALILLLFKRFLLSIIVFVFAAFITPTLVSLSALKSLATADLSRMSGYMPALSQISVTQFWVIVLVVGVVVSFGLYHRSVAESASIVVVIGIAIALLYAGPSRQSSIPAELRPATLGERNDVHMLSSWAATNWTLAIVIALAAVFFLVSYYGDFRGVLGTVVAIIATVALFPYVYNIYPVPRHSDYYVEALHQIWLPAERIQLSSGLVYYGYVLSDAGGWFTVLLTSRTIVYFAADEVVKRSVCQPRGNAQAPPHPPLVPILYSWPAPTTPCALSDISAVLTPFRSQGQSLRKISEVVHVHPWRIISVTNAHEHEELTAGLRAYERADDWNAPTPAGQYFWYYPPVTPPSAHP